MDCRKLGKELGIMRIIRMLACIAAMTFIAGSCFGGDADKYFIPLPMQYGLFGGAGLANPSIHASHGSLHLGVSMDMVPTSNYPERKHFVLGGISFEGGYAGAVNDLGNGSAFASFIAGPEFIISHHNRMTVFANGGYTRLFGTGNALNFGSGLNIYFKDSRRALRFEVRDYWHIAHHPDHNVAFRIGYLICIEDT
jgi:hypothetical protein